MSLRSSSPYADLNPFFDPTNSTSLVVYGDTALKYSISHLLTSYVGGRSRTFNSEWGSDILALLAEPLDSLSAQKIKLAIVSAIDKYEPRVSVRPSGVTVTPNPYTSSYTVVITFTANATGVASTMAVNLGTN